MFMEATVVKQKQYVITGPKSLWDLLVEATNDELGIQSRCKKASEEATRKLIGGDFIVKDASATFTADDVQTVADLLGEAIAEADIIEEDARYRSESLQKILDAVLEVSEGE